MAKSFFFVAATHSFLVNEAIFNLRGIVVVVLYKNKTTVPTRLKGMV